MRYYPNFSDVFDDLFDSGVNTTKANTMLCDIRETENTYEMNIAHFISIFCFTNIT